MDSHIKCSCGAKSFYYSNKLYNCPKCNSYYSEEEFDKNRAEYLSELNK